MFSRSRNPLLTFPLSFHVWVTSKIQVNFRFKRFDLRGKLLMIVSYGISQFLNYLCFEVKEINPLLIFLLSYHVPVTSKIQVNFGFKRFSEVLMILSYEFSQFLNYLCFQDQGIHCWHSYWATMFVWPRKSKSTSGSRGTLRYLLMIVSYGFSQFLQYLYMFSRSSYSLLAILPSYHVWMTSKISANPGTGGTLRYWWLCLIDFHNFFTSLCFWDQGIHCWHSYEAILFGWPWKPLEPEVVLDFRGPPNMVAQ